MNVEELLSMHAEEQPKGTPTLTMQAVQRMLPLVPGWEVIDNGKMLRWQKRFNDFQAAIDFVNKVAALAQEQDHHPDIRVHGYRNAELLFSTHSIGGLSHNDFILAAKVNKLLEET